MEKFLYEQNLHWQDKYFNAGIKRELLTSITPLIKLDQIIAVTGIRRCGKSFLLKQIVNQLIENGVKRRNILLLNLEFPAFMGENSNEILDTVFNMYKRLNNPSGRIYILFDEIQSLTGWERWIKYQYDQNKGKYKFFITGSNSDLLSSEFSERLSGRIIEKILYPFSFKEYLTAKGYKGFSPQKISVNKHQILHYLDQYMEEGGMPEVISINGHEVKRELLLSYFNTIIYKDVVARYSIRNSHAVQNLALYVMNNSGSMLNISKLTDSIKVGKREKVWDYFNDLEKVYLISQTAKFDYSLKKQLLSQKKGYCIDTGFINLLTLRFSPNKGNLLENMVYTELKRRKSKIYYYRNNGDECDFIIYDKLSKIATYQVCYELTDSNKNREIRGLLAGCKKINSTGGMIITYDQEDTFEKDGIEVKVIPFWKWVLDI